MLATHHTHSVLGTLWDSGETVNTGSVFRILHAGEKHKGTYTCTEWVSGTELALWRPSERTLLLLVKEHELFSDFPVLPRFYLKSPLNLSQSRKYDLIDTLKEFYFPILTFLLLPLFWGPSRSLHSQLTFPLVWSRCVSTALHSTRR